MQNSTLLQKKGNEVLGEKIIIEEKQAIFGLQILVNYDMVINANHC